MTDMPNLKGAVNVGNQFQARRPTFEIEDAHWGYTIRGAQGTRASVVVLQAVCLLLGASGIAVGLGLMVLPGVLAGSADPLFRTVAAILAAAVGAYLLWFSTRGTVSEIQIDTSRGEVREVIRNRAGRQTLVGRYGFDAIGGVFMDRQERPRGQAHLVLRYRNTAQTLQVATGTEAALSDLRDRLGRDLILTPGAA